MRRVLLSLWITLFGLLVPLGTVIAADCSVRLADTIAGFGTTATVQASSAWEIVVSPPSGKDIKLSGEGDDEVEIDSQDTERAGTYEAALSVDGDTCDETTFEVFPGSPAELSLNLLDALRKGKEAIIEGSVQDEFGNGIEARPLFLLVDQGEVRELDDDEETNEEGVMEFGLIPEKNGSVSITLVDLLSKKKITEEFEVSGTKSSVSLDALRASLLEEFGKEEEEEPASAQPPSRLRPAGKATAGREEEPRRYGFVDRFEVRVEPQVRAHESVDMEVLALDRDGNLVRDYIGRIVIETSDPEGEVPLKPRFYASDQGKLVFPLGVRFSTPGTQTVTVEDEEDADVTGKATVRVSGSDAPIERGHIVIASPKSPATVSKSPAAFTVKAPAYINLDVYVNGVKALSGASDEEGEYSFQLPLDLTQTTQEVYVQEGEGGLDRKSGAVTLIVDTSAPSIESLTLLPERVTAGAAFTVSVAAEAGQTVTAQVGSSAEAPLQETGPSEHGGHYSGTLTAPETAGTVTVTAAIRDAAGNTVRETNILTVLSPGLPAVSQPQAVPQQQEILLSWPAVPGATSYRVYFGVTPSDLSRHIDTGSSATSVRLRGLSPGQTYFFSITALGTENAESSERSPVVSATPGGSLFRLTVLPLVNGARLTWAKPTDLTVRAYRIQYGVQPGIYTDYTEQRLLAPSAITTDLSDLINGVKYYISFSALLEDNTLRSEQNELTVTPGRDGRAGMEIAPLDPLPAHLAVGGPLTRDVPSHGSADDLPDAPAMPRSGFSLGSLEVAGYLSAFPVVFLGFFFARRKFAVRRVVASSSIPAPSDPSAWQASRIQW